MTEADSLRLTTGGTGEVGDGTRLLTGAEVNWGW